MDAFTLKGPLRDHEKWIELSPTGRGAWITLMTIGHSQPGNKRWTLGTRRHVVALMRREGFGDPESTLEELLAARLVDDSEGVLSMHDAPDHQRFDSDRPERVAERQRQFRERRRSDVAAQEITAGNE